MDLEQLSPLDSEHINLTDEYAWEAEESLNPDQPYDDGVAAGHADQTD